MSRPVLRAAEGEIPSAYSPPWDKSHMSLVAVVSDARTIAATLTAIGVSPRAPPIASACGTGVFGYVDAEPIVEWDD